MEGLAEAVLSVFRCEASRFVGFRDFRVCGFNALWFQAFGFGVHLAFSSYCNMGIAVRSPRSTMRAA